MMTTTTTVVSLLLLILLLLVGQEGREALAFSTSSSSPPPPPIHLKSSKLSSVCNNRLIRIRSRTTVMASTTASTIGLTTFSDDDDDDENDATSKNDLLITQTAAAAATTVATSPSGDKEEKETSNSIASTSSISGAAIKIPSYKQLITFVSATMLIWLSEPLLSLVDTTIVGRMASTPAVGAGATSTVVQLASLGPATTLYDSLLYLCYFLAIATTNKIAPALASKNYRELQQTTSHVMGVSVVLGTLTTAIVFGFGKILLSQMIGGGGGASAMNLELLKSATSYAYIRAAVGIAAVTGMVMQSLCLCTFDTKTPTRAVAYASIANIVGDILFVKQGYGIQGAAIATSIATVISSTVLFRAVQKQMKQWRKLELLDHKKKHKQQHQQQHQLNEEEEEVTAVEEHQIVTVKVEQKAKSEPILMPMANQTEFLMSNGTEANASAGMVVSSSVSTSTDATESSHPAPTAVAPPPTPPKQVPFLSLPDRASFLQLCKLSGPIFFVIMSKVACYGAMTLRTTNFGNYYAMAAQNIMMRIFFFFGTFGDALSQTAQSFMPATLYPKPSRTAYRQILKRLLMVTSVMAIFNGNVSMLILKKLGQFLTSDNMIVQLMSDHASFLGISVLIHPFIILLEGCVIASRDFNTLVTTYLCTLGLHFTILKYFTGSFTAVWRTFFLFQTIRFVNFAFQVYKKQMTILNKQRTAAAAAAAAK